MSILIMDMDPSFACSYCGCRSIKLTRHLTWECVECGDATTPEPAA